jgi:hypothetical protein
MIPVPQNIISKEVEQQPINIRTSEVKNSGKPKNFSNPKKYAM